MNSEYRHTQYSPLHYLLYVIAAVLLVVAWQSRHQDVGAAIVVTAAAGLFLGLAQCFRYLTVRDDGDALLIRFGPLPLFRKRIRYADITAVAATRSALIDGWGMHWLPWRGATYNLWGFDCVEITLGDHRLRVGSDDVPNLVAFLESKIRC